MSYELIIFDCDGTLVDSHDMNHSIMAQVANDYGDLSYTMKSVEQEYLGIDYTKFFRLVSEKEGVEIPPEAGKKCLELARAKIPTMMQKIDGCYEALEMLASRYKMTVASNANKQMVLDSLAAVGVSDFFDSEAVVAGRAMATPKPAPDLFLLAAEKKGVEAQKCLVIEDSVTGIQGAVAAGMEVWGFTGVSLHPEKQEKAMIEAGATRVFPSLIHIAEALGV